MNKLPIVFVCDKNFIMPTSVAVTSLCENKKKDTFLDIYILGGDLDEEFEKTFEYFRKYDNCSITCLKRPLDRFSDIVQISTISPACLLKFEVSEVLSQYDKILYIDSDMIVREDLWDFYNTTDISDVYFAAVLHSECILDKTERINGGFLLFNAKKMREENMYDTLLAYRKALGNRKSMDQQTFNEVCKGHIKFLSSRYNCMPYRYQQEQIPQFYTMDEFNSFFGTNYRNWKEAVKDAAVIHYITGEKPWLYKDIKFGDEWMKYYYKSPYGNIELKRKGKIDRFKKKLSSGGWSEVIEFYIKQPLRAVYYSMRSLEFRKSKWPKSNWG